MEEAQSQETTNQPTQAEQANNPSVQEATAEQEKKSPSQESVEEVPVANTPPASAIAAGTAQLVADGVQVGNAAAEGDVGTIAISFARFTSDAVRFGEMIINIPQVHSLLNHGYEFGVYAWEQCMEHAGSIVQLSCLSHSSLPWCETTHEQHVQASNVDDHHL